MLIYYLILYKLIMLKSLSIADLGLARRVRLMLSTDSVLEPLGACQSTCTCYYWSFIQQESLTPHSLLIGDFKESLDA